MRLRNLRFVQSDSQLNESADQLIGGPTACSLPSSNPPPARRHRSRDHLLADQLVTAVELRAQRYDYVSKPAPPHGLWRTLDAHFLEKVQCSASFVLTHVDPKNGLFQGRLRVTWRLRTVHEPNERHEPRIREPRIRAKALTCYIHESRIWREMTDECKDTVLWHGITILTFVGHEIFPVQDFPFDRQLINLDVLEFVWRDKNMSDPFDETFSERMKVVTFTTKTSCTLPEWTAFPAILTAEEVQLPSGPTNVSRCTVMLRIQRKPDYYVWQVFAVGTVILIAAMLPLGLGCSNSMVGDRMNLHACGLLTLVLFKYSVSRDLPVVPYSTMISRFLEYQIITLAALCLESVLAYKALKYMFVSEFFLFRFEDSLLIILSCGWVWYFVECAFCTDYADWDDVIRDRTGDNEELIDELTPDVRIGRNAVDLVHRAVSKLEGATLAPIILAKRAVTRSFTSVFYRTISPDDNGYTAMPRLDTAKGTKCRMSNTWT